MGFFKSIAKGFEKVVVKNIVKPIGRDPIKALTIIGSPVGAATHLAGSQIGGKTGQHLKIGANLATTAVLSVAAPVVLAGTQGIQIASAIASPPKPQIVPQTVQGGVAPMALDLGGLLKSVGGIFGGGQNQIFTGISNVANLASQFIPAKVVNPVTTVAMRPPAPATTAVARALPMIGRTFFQKFPNLATSLQQLRARGMNVKRSQLWSMLKRFGPEVLVTGGLLTAAAVSELMIAGPGHRRINVTNVRALRRSVRRLKSFDRLSATVSRQLARVGGSKRRSSRRCGTCRKNPCSC